MEGKGGREKCEGEKVRDREKWYEIIGKGETGNV